MPKSAIRAFTFSNWAPGDFLVAETPVDQSQMFADLEAARLSVFKYIEMFYNAMRLHQTLGYQSPNQFEAEHAPATAA